MTANITIKNRRLGVDISNWKLLNKWTSFCRSPVAIGPLGKKKPKVSSDDWLGCNRCYPSSIKSNRMWKVF